VCYDDNTDLGLEGAHSALPIWAEFMKAAHALRAYKNPGEFEVPEGIVTVELDPDTGELATYACPRREKEVFIAGSQPTTFCRFHGSGGQLALATNVAGWDNGNQETAESDAEPAQNEGLRRAEASAETGQKPSPKVETEKKRGIFGRVLGIFK
jgi:penicillin-binding protein 1B